jgi:hypothetical protein
MISEEARGYRAKMNSKRMLIRGGQIYDHDADVHKPAVANLLIEGDKILAIVRSFRSMAQTK